MAGRRRRSKALQGGALADVTEAQYRKAADMVRAGAYEIEIRAVCRFTAGQWHALKHRGDPDRQWPPLVVKQAEETAAAIEAGKSAAMAIGRSVGEQLGAASVICGNAQMIINEILTAIGTNIAANAKSGDPKKLDDVLPGKKATDLLKVLAPYANPGAVADAFHRMYGERAGAVAVPGAGRQRLDGIVPAAIEMLRDRLGDEAADAAASALVSDIFEWTEGQLDRFLETGEEPAENEVGPQTH